MAGIGKTALALELAHKLITNYSDGQIYIDLKGVETSPLQVTDAMAEVIRTFHPDFKPTFNEEKDIKIYRSTIFEKKLLILVDNAIDAKQIEPLIPPTKSSIIIITSRHFFTIRGGYALPLAILKPTDARELLLSIAPSVSGSVADQICYLCGYLPLATCAAASQIANSLDLEPSNYVKELTVEKSRLEKIGFEGVDISVEASFNLSYKALSPALADGFRLLAVFVSSFDMAAVENIFGTENNLLRELVKRSLVLYNKVTGRYYLHDLMRIFALKQLTEIEYYAAQKRYSFYYLQVLITSNTYYSSGNNDTFFGLKIFDIERENIEAGHIWAITNSNNDKESAQLCCDYSTYGMAIYQLRLSPNILIEHLKAAIMASRLLNKRNIECAHLGNLGITYLELGDIKTSINCYNQSIQLYQVLKDKKGEGAVLISLGTAYARLGKLREAIDCYEKALKICSETKNKEYEARALGNLGLAYIDLNEIKLAQECLEKTLLITRELGDVNGEIACLCNLSSFYLKTNRIRQAINNCNDGLAISEKLTDSYSKGYFLHLLGNIYKELGELKTSVDYFNQSLALAKEHKNSRLEATILCNLAATLDRLDQNQEAINCYKRALSILTRIEDKFKIEDVLIALAWLFQKISDPTSAIKYLEKGLVITNEIGDLKKEGEILGLLARFHSETGNITSCFDCYEKQLKIACQLGDKGAESKIYDELGITHLGLGHYDQALDYQEKALTISQVMQNREGEAIILINMVSTYDQLNMEEKSIECCQRALSISQEICNLTIEGTSLYQLANLLAKIGKYEQAVIYGQSALNIFEHLQNSLADRLKGLMSNWRSKLTQIRLDNTVDTDLYPTPQLNRNINFSSSNKEQSRFTIFQLNTDNKAVLFKLEAGNDNSKKVVLDNIELICVEQNENENIFTNEHQSVPWKVKLTESHKRGSFHYEMNFSGVNVEIALSAAYFLDLVAKGEKISLIHIESGDSLAELIVNPADTSNEEHFISLLENLAYIQSKIKIPIMLPGRNFSSEVEEKIFTIANIIKYGKLNLSVKTIQQVVPKATLLNLINNCKNIGEINGFCLVSEKEQFDELFDITIPMGINVLFCKKVKILNFETLKQSVDSMSMNESIVVSFQAMDNESFQVQFQKWLNQQV